MKYDHTQNAPLNLILSAVGFALLVAAWKIPAQGANLVLMIMAAIFFLLALMFGCLTVRVQGDELLVQFGPLPLFRRGVRYADVQSVKRGRTTVFDGWGIHISPSGGWTWNLWGFDCVDVHFTNGGRLRIGSDDADRLESFLTRQLEQIKNSAF
ncbi:MAG: hypothetical protein N2C14_18340 [Planctomycetales bacterium]